MIDPLLVEAVERWAAATQAAPDAKLDRPWAWGAYDSEGARFAFFRTYEQLRELAVRLAAGRSPSQAQRILGHYHAAFRDLEAVLLGVPPGLAAERPAEGEWSVRQTLAHVLDANIGFYVLVRHALDRHRAGDWQPAGIPDEVWDRLTGLDEAAANALFEQPSDGLLAAFGEWHDRVLAEFAGVGDAELELPSRFWEGYDLPIRFRLHRFDSHLRQHTIQIEKTLAAQGRAPTEARRLLRLIYAALAEAEAALIGTDGLVPAAWQETAGEIAARAAEMAELAA